MYRDGLFCPMSQMVMGETADLYSAEQTKFPARTDQFALWFTMCARPLLPNPVTLDAEIAPVTIAGTKVRTVVLPRLHCPEAPIGKNGPACAVFSKTRQQSLGAFLGNHRRARGIVLASRELRQTGRVYIRQAAAVCRASLIAVTRLALDPRRIDRPCRPIPKNGGEPASSFPLFDLIE